MPKGRAGCSWSGNYRTEREPRRPSRHMAVVYFNKQELKLGLLSFSYVPLSFLPGPLIYPVLSLVLLVKVLFRHIIETNACPRDPVQASTATTFALLSIDLPFHLSFFLPVFIYFFLIRIDTYLYLHRIYIKVFLFYVWLNSNITSYQ